MFGISPDSSQSHHKFRAKYELSFLLLSDPDHGVLRADGVWGLKKRFGQESEGVIRSTFIIDTDEKVFKVWRSIKVDGHVEQVLTEVLKLIS